MIYNRVIIGAGLYGLYSAWVCGRKKLNVLVLECEQDCFKRATYVNQARVHMGYHYPRSLSTAKKSAEYFKRFCDDFGFCINKKFKQIYATSSNYSWTSANQFEKFCKDAEIKCERLNPTAYFNRGMCDGAFLTEEYTYDAMLLKDFFLKELSVLPNVTIKYNSRIESIKKEKNTYHILLCDRTLLETDYILNVAYAGVNQILSLAGYDPFHIKYELCEIILCEVNDNMKDLGLTVMDGPFFSIMPFGKTGLHSLTSVSFTPHVSSYTDIPFFLCQKKNVENYCNEQRLGNCNECTNRPKSAWEYMSALARKYIIDKYEWSYKKSLFSMKPILRSSEVDDSRPTVIEIANKYPTFISVLSGKINTVYDLDKVLMGVNSNGCDV